MEDLGNPVKLELSLLRLAMTAVVANVYEEPIIKQKMKNIIITSYVNKHSFPFELLKSEINKLAREKLESLNLPQTLMSKAQAMAVIFARKTVCWAHCVGVVKLDTSYLDIIYWTSIGTIDEAKIFDAYWRKHGNFTGVLTRNAECKGIVPDLACIYANEEVLLTFQAAMIKEVQNFLGQVKLPEITDFDEFLATYMSYHFSEGCDEFRASGKLDIEDIIIKCGAIGLIKPIKRFLNLLNNVEKERIQKSFDSVMRDLVPSYTNSEEDVHDEIKRARYAEVLYFLINIMSPKRRIEFLKSNFWRVIDLFLNIWPYQEICLKILSEDWISGIEDHDWEKILHEVLQRMVIDNLSQSCFFQDLSYEILRKVMENSSKSVKETIVFSRVHTDFETKRPVKPIRYFYKKFDVTALNIIINDKDLKSKRDMMIRMGDSKIWKLKKSGNLKLLMSFIENVLVSKEERIKFIKHFKLLENFLNFLKADNPDFRQKVLMAKCLIEEG